jgi:hypothetical protein
MGLSQFDETYPVNITTAILAIHGTTPLPNNNSGVGACRIDQIWATNDDAIPHVVSVGYYQGGANFLMGSVSVPVGAGFAGTPGIELLSAILGAQNQGIVLQSADYCGVGVEVAMVGTSRITLVFLGGQV